MTQSPLEVIFLDFGSDGALERTVLHAIRNAARSHRGGHGRIQLEPVDPTPLILRTTTGGTVDRRGIAIPAEPATDRKLILEDKAEILDRAAEEPPTVF